MAHARLPRLTILILLTILLVAGAVPAWAGDEKEGESAAEKLFIAAWWLETSSGALDQAAEGYRKAVAAEGPAAIRAKALYRLAVVLERIGKTGEAIRALERLASDFPNEADLQAQARERLEEWTAVDLRTNFEEWYRRYQYSPEFQARIVELVLKLGGDPTSGTVHAAYRELLTIGAASVPALEAHLETTSSDLRRNAVRILMLLGKIPPVRHLVETDDWKKEQSAWDLFLSADAETRGGLRAQLVGDTAVERVLFGLLDGPASWAAAFRHEPSMHLFLAMLERDEFEQQAGAFLELVSSLEGDQSKYSDSLAWQLMERGHVPDALILEWLAVPEVQARAARMIAEGKVRSPDALAAVSAAMMAPARPGSTSRDLLFLALLQAISDAPAEADLTHAGHAFERAWRGILNNLGGIRMRTHYALTEPADARRRLFEAVIDQAEDPAFALEVLKLWRSDQKSDPEASRHLLRWAATAQSSSVARYAGNMAGYLASEATLDEVLAAQATLPWYVAHDLIAGLAVNRSLQDLPWTDDRLWVLVSLLGDTSDRSNQVEIVRLWKTLMKTPDRYERMIRLAFEDPVRAGKEDLSLLIDQVQSSESEERVRAEILQRWPGWSDEERFAVLRFFGRLWGDLDPDAPFAAFLRSKLHAAVNEDLDAEAQEQAKAVKLQLFYALPSTTVDDVRAAYDLSTPEGALAAYATHRLPHTAETYDLLAAAREVEDAEKRRSFLNAWIQHGEDDMECRAARAMASDIDAFTRKVGLDRLSQSRRAADIRVFEKALEDPSSDVRYIAAEALAGAYDKEAIQSLVKVLDDPDADVRDQVLKTLEAIKEIESKKEYWREFAENAR